MPRKIRTQTPPHYSHYEEYKGHLRLEFEYSCAYCNVCEPEFGGSKCFQIDHYAPQRKFPKKVTEYSNLFYSCHECNKLKGGFWPTKCHQESGQFILNPCDHDLEEHFDRRHEEWIAKSTTAAWNITRLRLNSVDMRNIRKRRASVIEKIKELEYQKKEIVQLLLEVKDDRSLKEEFDLKLSEIQNQIDIHKGWITGPMD